MLEDVTEAAGASSFGCAVGSVGSCTGAAVVVVGAAAGAAVEVAVGIGAEVGAGAGTGVIRGAWPASVTAAGTAAGCAEFAFCSFGIGVGSGTVAPVVAVPSDPMFLSSDGRAVTTAAVSLASGAFPVPDAGCVSDGTGAVPGTGFAGSVLPDTAVSEPAGTAGVERAESAGAAAIGASVAGAGCGAAGVVDVGC